MTSLVEGLLLPDASLALSEIKYSGVAVRC
jgi:hypothetical protein